MCVSNPQNEDFDDLPSDGDQRLITWQLIYSKNDDNIESFKSCLIVDVYTNWMKKIKVQFDAFIDWW